MLGVPQCWSIKRKDQDNTALATGHHGAIIVNMGKAALLDVYNYKWSNMVKPSTLAGCHLPGTN